MPFTHLEIQIKKLQDELKKQKLLEKQIAGQPPNIKDAIYKRKRAAI